MDLRKTTKSSLISPLEIAYLLMRNRQPLAESPPHAHRAKPSNTLSTIIPAKNDEPVNKDTKPPSIGKPPSDSQVNLRPQDSSHEKTNTNLPIIATFLASTGLAIFTHVKDDLFGSLTKAANILFTFLAMFTGTVGFASVLQNNNAVTEGEELENSFGHGLH